MKCSCRRRAVCCSLLVACMGKSATNLVELNGEAVKPSCRSGYANFSSGPQGFRFGSKRFLCPFTLKTRNQGCAEGYADIFSDPQGLSLRFKVFVAS